MATASRRLNFGLFFATLAFASILVSLGFWQIDRAEQKQRIYDLYAARYDSPPSPLGEQLHKQAEDLHWLPVQAHGRFLGETYLLDNRVRAGTVGLEVLSVFELSAGQSVLIDRGWIPANPDRSTLPGVATPRESMIISGRVGPAPVTGVRLGNATDEIETFPNGISRIQVVDLGRLSQRNSSELSPFVIYLNPNSPAGYDCRWQAPGDGAAKHRAYAVQWFSMATVLIFIYIFLTHRSIKNRN